MPSPACRFDPTRRSSWWGCVSRRFTSSGAPPTSRSRSASAKSGRSFFSAPACWSRGGGLFLLMKALGAPLPSLRQWLNAGLLGFLLLVLGIGSVSVAEQDCELGCRGCAHQRAATARRDLGNGVRTQASRSRVGRDRDRRGRHTRHGGGPGLSRQPDGHGDHPARCAELVVRIEHRQQTGRPARRDGIRRGNADRRRCSHSSSARSSASSGICPAPTRCGPRGAISSCSDRSSRSRRIAISSIASSPTLAATYAYVNPPVALFVGWWLGAEHFAPNTFIGLPSCSTAGGACAVARGRRTWSWRTRT